MSSAVGNGIGAGSGGGAAATRRFGRKATARFAGSSWLAPKAKLAAITARRGQNSTDTGPFGGVAIGAARGAALLNPRM